MDYNSAVGSIPVHFVIMFPLNDFARVTALELAKEEWQNATIEADVHCSAPRSSLLLIVLLSVK